MALRIVTDDQRAIPLQPGRLIIGRDPENDIVFDKPGVSWRHAKISVTTDGIEIRDNRSTNGTFINDRRIDTDIARCGDKISFGQHCTCRLENTDKQSRDSGRAIGWLRNQSGVSFAVKEGVMMLGRADDADFRIGEMGVSKYHARVICRGHFVILEDMDSTNGCFINGARIKKQRLRAGDEIDLGKYRMHWNSADKSMDIDSRPQHSVNKSVDNTVTVIGLCVVVALSMVTLFYLGNSDVINRVIKRYEYKYTMAGGGGGFGTERDHDNAQRQREQNRLEKQRRLVEQRRREAEQQRLQAIDAARRLAQDSGFAGRLEGLAQLAANGADTMRVVNGMLGRGSQLLDSIADKPMGSKVLQQARLDNLPHQFKRMSNDIAELNQQLNDMKTVSGELLSLFNRYQASRDDVDLKQMGSTAHRAAVLASRLSDSARQYRETLEQGVTQFNHAAEVLDQVPFMSAIADGLRAWAMPAESAAGFLNKLESRVDQERDNFKLLQNGAEAV